MKGAVIMKRSGRNHSPAFKAKSSCRRFAETTRWPNWRPQRFDPSFDPLAPPGVLNTMTVERAPTSALRPVNLHIDQMHANVRAIDDLILRLDVDCIGAPPGDVCIAFHKR